MVSKLFYSTTNRYYRVVIVRIPQSAKTFENFSSKKNGHLQRILCKRLNKCTAI